jgi:hypothetical protein
MKLKSLITRAFFYTSVIGTGILLLFFIIAAVWIGHDVKTQCKLAQAEYSGDCVVALIYLLEDESRGFKPRNDAIWALGQLGDNRALPALQKYYTGIIPDGEPLNQTLSQYELKKAINLASGGLNITAVFWRYTIY